MGTVKRNPWEHRNPVVLSKPMGAELGRYGAGMSQQSERLKEGERSPGQDIRGLVVIFQKHTHKP